MDSGTFGHVERKPFVGKGYEIRWVTGPSRKETFLTIWEKSALRKNTRQFKTIPTRPGQRTILENYSVFGPCSYTYTKQDKNTMIISYQVFAPFLHHFASHLVRIVECLVMPPTFTKEQPPSRDADDDEALSGSSAHSPMGLWCQECFERHRKQRRHQETWQMAWLVAWLVAWLTRQAFLLPGMFCIKRWTPCISAALLLCSQVFWVLSLATFNSCYTCTPYTLKRTIMKTTSLHSTTGISDQSDYMVWLQPSRRFGYFPAQAFVRTKPGWEVGSSAGGFADMFHLCSTFLPTSSIMWLSVAGLQIQGIHPHSLTPPSHQMAWYCHMVCKGLARNPGSPGSLSVEMQRRCAWVLSWQQGWICKCRG